MRERKEIKEEKREERKKIKEEEKGRVKRRRKRKELMRVGTLESKRREGIGRIE